MLPLFTICDRWDVGGVSMAMNMQTGEPTIFVYDGYPGGAGIAELAFEAAHRHAHATLELISRVPVRRRLPVVRPVTEVRELERVPRQSRCDRVAGFDDAGASRSGVAPKLIRELRELVVRRPPEELVSRRTGGAGGSGTTESIGSTVGTGRSRIGSRAGSGSGSRATTTGSACGAGATGADAVATANNGSSATARLSATARGAPLMASTRRSIGSESARKCAVNNVICAASSAISGTWTGTGTGTGRDGRTGSSPGAST